MCLVSERLVSLAGLSHPPPLTLNHSIINFQEGKRVMIMRESGQRDQGLWRDYDPVNNRTVCILYLMTVQCVYI